MKYWLFTWNPRKWPWDNPIDGYKEMIREVNAVGASYCKWSCGITKTIQPRDRIFIIRLGEKPRGIIASGEALTPVFEGTNWDETKAKQGKTVNRIYIKIDKIVDPATTILSIDMLKSISSTMCWTPQNSGISIPNDVAKVLENIWNKI